MPRPHPRLAGAEPASRRTRSQRSAAIPLGLVVAVVVLACPWATRVLASRPPDRRRRFHRPRSARSRSHAADQPGPSHGVDLLDRGRGSDGERVDVVAGRPGPRSAHGASVLLQRGRRRAGQLSLDDDQGSRRHAELSRDPVEAQPDASLLSMTTIAIAAVVGPSHIETVRTLLLIGAVDRPSSSEPVTHHAGASIDADPGSQP